MATLQRSSTASIFNAAMPRHTPEEWARINAEAAAWDAKEKAREDAARLKRSGIPDEYRDATLETAPDAVVDFAASPKGPGLLLMGAPGRGKTYAACAVLSANIGRRPVRFATMNGILRDLRSTFNGDMTESEVMGRYRGVWLLAIDDLGKENPTDWALPQLFELINGRKETGRPTIITTQYNGAELYARLSKHGDADTAAAIISRLKEYVPVKFDGPDRRHR